MYLEYFTYPDLELMSSWPSEALHRSDISYTAPANNVNKRSVNLSGDTIVLRYKEAVGDETRIGAGLSSLEDAIQHSGNALARLLFPDCYAQNNQFLFYDFAK